MKKFFLAIVAVVAMASCSNNESEFLKNPTNEMKFRNLNERVTRAANDVSSDYKVFAVSTLASESDWFIQDTIGGGTVPAETNLAKHGPYYWPAGKTVDFYSYAPAQSTNAVVTATYGSTPTFTTVYTVPANADEDFTMAAPKMVLDNTSGSGGDGTVEFVFEHMLSKISINVDISTSLKASGYELDLTGATVTLGLAYDQGTLSTMDGAAAFGSLALSGSGSYTKTAAVTSGPSFIIIPQASTSATIQFKGVVIKRNGLTIFPNDSGVSDLKVYEIDVNEIDDDMFKKKTHYTFNIEIIGTSHDDDDELIFGEEIKFSADINNWIIEGTTPNPIPQP